METMVDHQVFTVFSTLLIGVMFVVGFIGLVLIEYSEWRNSPLVRRRKRRAARAKRAMRAHRSW